MSIERKKYFYVKVIEAKDVVIRTNYYQSEPFVSIKMNGHEYIGKKTTNYHMGREWWDKIFRFTCHNVHTDWISVEVREKGFHLIGSDWLGEVQVKVKDYADGRVHQQWFKLGGGLWKNHTRKPKGCIHLSFQLMNNKYDHPFTSKPVERPLTYQEWQESLELRRTIKSSKGSSHHNASKEKNSNNSETKRHKKKDENEKKSENKTTKEGDTKKTDAGNRSQKSKSHKSRENKAGEKGTHRKKSSGNKEKSKEEETKEEKPTPPISENLIEFSPIVTKTVEKTDKFDSNNPFLSNPTGSISNPFDIDHKYPFGKPSPYVEYNPFLAV